LTGKLGVAPETSIGHGEGGRTSTILGLHDLVTAKLDTLFIVS